MVIAQRHNVGIDSWFRGCLGFKLRDPEELFVNPWGTELGAILVNNFTGLLEFLMISHCLYITSAIVLNNSSCEVSELGQLGFAIAMLSGGLGQHCLLYGCNIGQDRTKMMPR